MMYALVAQFGGGLIFFVTMARKIEKKKTPKEIPLLLEN